MTDPTPIPPTPPLSAPPALVCRGLSRRFGARVAVEALDFSVRGGEILGLVGPNGAGKTTTLRSIAGVLPLQDGSVSIGGHDLATDELEAKRRLAYVPDDPSPFEVLTVWEHLEFTARLFRVEGWESRAEELLERFELSDRRTALGSELSRGMRQKLSFCAAWLSTPAVCLLDEPLSGLDPRGIRSARAAIQELRDRGTAVVLSSHLLELIQALADRILILDKGQKVFEGTLADARTAVSLTENDSLEEIFFAATGDRSGGAPAAPADAADALPKSATTPSTVPSIETPGEPSPGPSPKQIDGDRTC